MSNLMEHEEIDKLIAKLLDLSNADVYKYSDKLAQIGGEYVVDKMIGLLYNDHTEVKHLAARTLARIKDNQSALEPLLEAINDKNNAMANGSMVEALMGFDCSEKFVDIFKLYLFGNLKASAMAKIILDFEEFDLTPRTIKKAEKHWGHYVHNTKHDEAFYERKKDVDELLNDLKMLFEDEEE